jgi:hypothetical protein
MIGIASPPRYPSTRSRQGSNQDTTCASISLASSAYFIRNVGITSPLLIVAAAATTWYDVVSIKEAARAISESKQRTSSTHLAIDRARISPEQALASARRLATLSPSARIAVNGSDTIISAMTTEQFLEWNHAVTTVQLTAQDVFWEAPAAVHGLVR